MKALRLLSVWGRRLGEVGMAPWVADHNTHCCGAVHALLGISPSPCRARASRRVARSWRRRTRGARRARQVRERMAAGGRRQRPATRRAPGAAAPGAARRQVDLNERS